MIPKRNHFEGSLPFPDSRCGWLWERTCKQRPTVTNEDLGGNQTYQHWEIKQSSVKTNVRKTSCLAWGHLTASYQRLSYNISPVCTSQRTPSPPLLCPWARPAWSWQTFLIILNSRCQLFIHHQLSKKHIRDFLERVEKTFGVHCAVLVNKSAGSFSPSV